MLYYETVTFKTLSFEEEEYDVKPLAVIDKSYLLNLLSKDGFVRLEANLCGIEYQDHIMIQYLSKYSPINAPESGISFIENAAFLEMFENEMKNPSADFSHLYPAQYGMEFKFSIFGLITEKHVLEAIIEKFDILVSPDTDTDPNAYNMGFEG